jgi:integrase/recombinase XerD
MNIQPLIDDRSIPPTFVSTPPSFPSGYNRSDAGDGMLSAKNDWDALLEFLSEYSDNVNTYRSYSRDVERFALWLIHEAGKGISDINRGDWSSFQSFLANPEQLKPWCAKKTRRFTPSGDINPEWRPFEKRKLRPPVNDPYKEMPYIYTLSSDSAKKTQKVIESLFGYLVDFRYLKGNPVSSRRTINKASRNHKKVKDRFLEIGLIDFTIDLLYFKQQQEEFAQKDTFPYIRARYIILLLAGTGLRISESANHRMGDISCRKEKWVLDIVGKGDKPRSISYLPDLIAATREFREEMNMPSSTPLYKEECPLIPRKAGDAPISDRRIAQILQWAFQLAVNAKLEEGEEYASKKSAQAKEKHGDLIREASILSNASAHWLRHSHATYYLQKTKDLKAVMERLGHTGVDTAMIYQHIVDDL